jgi:hypothetical protein
VKKTMAAPVSTPENPLGMNGRQFSVLIAPAAPMTKIKIAAILTSTITLFAPALSFTPRVRIKVRTRMSSNAGTLNQAPVNWPPAIIGLESATGRCTPKTASSMSLK